MIVVDFDTVLSDPAVVKAALIELVVLDPGAVIAVLNTTPFMSREDTFARLREVSFPCDVVMTNPLSRDIPPLVYKTMVAAKLQEQGEHVVTAVLDSDVEASQMWADSGVIAGG